MYVEAMGDDEFREFIEYVKEALLRKKRRFMEEGPPGYSLCLNPDVSSIFRFLR
jgi:hypothetical protein